MNFFNLKFTTLSLYVCVCVCAVLCVTACTKEAAQPEQANTLLNISKYEVPLDQVEFSPDMIAKTEGGTKDHRVRPIDCHCYLRVNSTSNIGAHLWGLFDVTYSETNPEMETQGSEGTWIPLTGGPQMPLPTPYFELSTPSTGDHTLQLFHDFTGASNASLNVSVVCTEESNGGFALANAYNFDLNFQDGQIFPAKLASRFDIFVSCNPNTIGNSGS